ncbi:MAG: MoaD/ThiS family protein [Chloroflexi bacterium]|nr:MoaD/ThiS family protein [Chloroflexota bacterium]
MEIQVELFASLRHYLPKGTKAFDTKLYLDGPMTVHDLFQKELKMPDDIIAGIVILQVNGAMAEKDRILADGDTVTALPVASGG